MGRPELRVKDWEVGAIRNPKGHGLGLSLCFRTFPRPVVTQSLHGLCSKHAVSRFHLLGRVPVILAWGQHPRSYLFILFFFFFYKKRSHVA